VRVQRLWMRYSGAESWTVLGDDPCRWSRSSPVSLAASNDKLAQLDRHARNATTVDLGVPVFTCYR
jgi:hypothetical protein